MSHYIKYLAISLTAPVAALGLAAALVQGVIHLRTDYQVCAAADQWMAADCAAFAAEITSAK